MEVNVSPPSKEKKYGLPSVFLRLSSFYNTFPQGLFFRVLSGSNRSPLDARTFTFSLYLTNFDFLVFLHARTKLISLFIPSRELPQTSHLLNLSFTLALAFIFTQEPEFISSRIINCLFSRRSSNRSLLHSTLLALSIHGFLTSHLLSFSCSPLRVPRTGIFFLLALSFSSCNSRQTKTHLWSFYLFSRVPVITRNSYSTQNITHISLRALFLAILTSSSHHSHISISPLTHSLPHHSLVYTSPSHCKSSQH